MKHENWWMMAAAAGTAVAIIGGTATAALAQPPATTTIVGERDMTADVRTVRVSYRDLNLAAARDERILRRRVSGAIRTVCADGMTAVEGVGFAPCARGARRDARPQIALAVRRARDIAATGTSSIPIVAIAISVR